MSLSFRGDGQVGGAEPWLLPHKLTGPPKKIKNKIKIRWILGSKSTCRGEMPSSK